MPLVRRKVIARVGSAPRTRGSLRKVTACCTEDSRRGGGCEGGNAGNSSKGSPMAGCKPVRKGAMEV